jgi:hypothetical protein
VSARSIGRSKEKYRYRVEGNGIIYDIGQGEPNHAGIVVMNSGVTNNLIYRNSFMGCDQDLQSLGTNKSTDGITGLKFLCNNVRDPGYRNNNLGITVMKDFYPNANNGINKDQFVIDPVTGLQKSAANTFTQYLAPLYNIPRDYYLETGTNDLSAFKYKYYNGVNTYQYPTSNNIGNILTANPNACPAINTRGPQAPIPYMAMRPAAPRFSYFAQRLQNIETQISGIEANIRRTANDTLKLSSLLDQQSALIDSMAAGYQGKADSLILMYKQVTKGYHYQLLLSGAYMAKGQYDNATATLRNIAAHYTITTDEAEQIRRLGAIYQVQQWLQLNHYQWAKIPSAYKATVYECEAKDPMYAGATARALLIRYEGRRYDPLWRVPTPTKAMMGTAKAAPTADRCYPNPTTKTIFIDWDGEAGNILDITDLSGKKVKSITLLQGNNTIDLRQLAVGMYIVQIKADNAILYQQKITKQ